MNSTLWPYSCNWRAKDEAAECEERLAIVAGFSESGVPGRICVKHSDLPALQKKD